MKRLLLTIIVAVSCLNAAAQLPKGYESKTARLAENLVNCSRKGNYNKTYHALRKIQKYEYRLDKDQLISFYSDIHDAVLRECIRQGLDENAQAEMKIIIDALFSDGLKEAVKAQN